MVGRCWFRRCGLIALQKDFTNYLPKLQSCAPASDKAGEGGGEKRQGKERGRERKREREGEKARDAFQSFSSNWRGEEKAGAMWNRRGQRWVSRPCEKVVNQDGLSNDHFLLKPGGSGGDNSADVLDEFGTKLGHRLPACPL